MTYGAPHLFSTPVVLCLCVFHRQCSVYWSTEQTHQPRSRSTGPPSSTWPAREAAPTWSISSWRTTWTWTRLTHGGTQLSGRPAATDTSTSSRNCFRSEQLSSHFTKNVKSKCHSLTLAPQTIVFTYFHHISIPIRNVKRVASFLPISTEGLR